MTQQLGRLVICDRCGKTVFEPWKSMKNDNSGWSDYLCFEHTDGWIEPDFFNLNKSQMAYNSHQSLCPECEAIRKNVIEKFWSND